MSGAVTKISIGGSAFTPLPQWDTHRFQGHSVQFYEKDAFLLEEVGRFLGSAIGAGDAALAITTEAHKEGLYDHLRHHGIDRALAVNKQRFLWLNADGLLKEFMVAGSPDPGRFLKVMGDLIDRFAHPARGERCRVAIFGEMVAVLWDEGKRDAAIRMEELWNLLAQSHSFQLHCAYPMRFFSQPESGSLLAHICAEHSAVAPSEQYTAAALSVEERLRAIVLLQQKAQALEAQIREREEIQQALEKSEAELKKYLESASHLAAIVESSDDAIISKDLNGTITSWNSSAERILGYKREEVIGKSILLIIPPDLHGDETMILSKIRAGERIEHFQTVRVHKSGERLDVSLTISPVKDRRGKIVGATKILRDITEQKKLEKALHTTEKLASVGRLAATIAHEINNPLEGVTNFIYLARQRPEISGEVKQYLESADRELRRAAHIAQQTLGFYRDTSQPVLMSVSGVIEDVLTIYQRKFDYKQLRIERQIEAGLEIRAWQGELKQVLSNLMANALDASNERGRIIIRARSSRTQNGNPEIQFTIADNGIGVQDSVRGKLFTPFFTTKKEVGTGLGLWITKDLLEKRGGRIRLRSRESSPSGTVISFCLPVSQP